MAGPRRRWWGFPAAVLAGLLIALVVTLVVVGLVTVFRAFI